MGKTKKDNAWRALSATGALATALFLHLPVAQADPAAKVYLPAVVQGEVELELRGDFQRWRNHDDDFARATEHKIGPAFFSQAALGARKVKFDAAVLFGLNRNSPDTTVRFNLEYEIY